MILAALVVASLGAVDPCAPIEPAPERDAAAAAAFEAVGQEEEAAGWTSTAAVAYVQAVRLDPGRERPTGALGRMCRRARLGGDPLRQAMAKMDRGERREAIALFEEIRADRDDRRAALLEGICLYELGEDKRAWPLLEEARQNPELADTARFFLGLLAYHQGRDREAVELLQPVAISSDPSLRDSAHAVLQLAGREGRLELSLATEGGFDSATEVAPDGTLRINGGGPGAHLGGSLVARPLGVSGPYGRVRGAYREPLSTSVSDFGTLGLGAGWQVGRGRTYWVAEYAFEHDHLAGLPYADTHQVVSAFRVPLHRLSVTGSYTYRREGYARGPNLGYSGPKQLGTAELAYPFASGSQLAIGGAAALSSPADAWLGYGEAGPRGMALLRLSQDLLLSACAQLSWRRYAGPAAPAEPARKDTLMDLSASLEQEIDDHWTFVASFSWQDSNSNLRNLSYDRVLVSMGLSYAAGFF